MTEREKWLQERKNGIGGSDASAVLGESPYKTNVQLWKEKTGAVDPQDISDKPCVEYGTNAEEPLRQLFMLDNPQYSLEYNQYKIIQNSEKPYIFATLDGELTEIATGRKGNYEGKTAEIRKKSELGEWENRIPQGYYIQVLHQLLAREEAQFTELQVQLKVYNIDDTFYCLRKQYLIERNDVEKDIEYLKGKEIYFWENYVVKKIRPATILPKI
jgi:putative phage-type endonuclease